MNITTRLLIVTLGLSIVDPQFKAWVVRPIFAEALGKHPAHGMGNCLESIQARVSLCKQLIFFKSSLNDRLRPACYSKSEQIGVMVEKEQEM
jgi:hypothetical protein